MGKKISLLEHLAIGDSFGAPFEFKDKEFINKNFNIDSYLNTIGTYTDDTQMSIAIVEHLLDMRIFTLDSYADYFLNQYHNDVNRNGFSKRTKALLKENYSDSNGLLIDSAMIIPRDSNGCVMRVLPIGLIKNIGKLKQAALMQCVVTHPSLDCILASQTISLFAHYLYYEIEYGLSDFMIQHIGKDNFDRVIKAWKEGDIVKCDALGTVSFCIFNVTSSLSMAKLLEASIKVGGDVDSTAALCLGLASLRENTIFDLPHNLYNNLENSKFGKNFLKSKDKELQDNLSLINNFIIDSTNFEKK